MLKRVVKKIVNYPKMSVNKLIDELQKHAAVSEASAANVVDAVLENILKPNHQSVFWGDRLLTIDKSAGFLDDPVFHEAFSAVRGSHAYDQYQSPQTISWRLHTLVWAAKCGLNVEGDFVECGTFKGDMAWVIAKAADFRKQAKRFYLYDTFDGFSDKYSSKDDYPENPAFFDFANKVYKDPSLYPYVRDRFADRDDIEVIKGVVPDVLEEKCPQKIAFLHIDLNSPAAEIGALEILFPRMSSGAILIFDDYGWKLYRKQKEAEDAFMRDLGYEILELPTGQGLVVKR